MVIKKCHRNVKGRLHGSGSRVAIQRISNKIHKNRIVRLIPKKLFKHERYIKYCYYLHQCIILWTVQMLIKWQIELEVGEHKLSCFSLLLLIFVVMLEILYDHKTVTAQINVQFISIYLKWNRSVRTSGKKHASEWLQVNIIEIRQEKQRKTFIFLCL